MSKIMNRGTWLKNGIAAWLLFSCATLMAESSVETSTSGVQVDLGNGVQLNFALHGDYLLGLHRASVAGVQLKSDRTVQRPVLAQEWDADRIICPFMRFVDARVKGEGVEIKCQLLATSDEKAFRSFFMFGGDRDRALAEGMSPELRELKKQADAADAKILAAVVASPDYIKKLKRIEEDKAKALKSEDPLVRFGYERGYNGARRNLVGKMRGKLLAATPELAAEQKKIAGFERALVPVAARLGNIFRDFYRHAQIRLPANICATEFVARTASELRASLRPAGTLTWIIEPDQRNIAGWGWVGWKQRFAFELADGKKVNAIRVLGTWELDGTATDLTVVNLRYRGLGRIEQTFTAGPEGGVREAWTTAEIMPGAAGEGYAVSPRAPSTDVKKLTDRAYALRHREGAWICRMARGGGTGFVDFQHRPHAVFCAFPERQGNLRALSECFPGDAVLSQTDEEYFALTDRHETIPMNYLALVSKDAPLTQDEIRTRWQEVDQLARDQVSQELNFVQYEPMPGIGRCDDLKSVDYMRGSIQAMADKRVDKWAGEGVHWIVTHYMRGWHDRKKGPGIKPELVEAQQNFTRACARRGVAYFQWWSAGGNDHCVTDITGDTKEEFYRVVGKKPLAGKFGPYFAISAPQDYSGGGMGYGKPDKPGRGPMAWNPNHPKVYEWYANRLRKMRDDNGMQGVWLDSYQNFAMSHLAYGDGTGDSTQRKWWELWAAMSREGVALMSESHGFPALSCSIEVPDWEKDYWYFQYVWKWHRGNEQSHYAPEELDDLCFRVMANKGWTAPECGFKGEPTTIPSFVRFAGEYVAALPSMRRSYVLGEKRGVLWLPFTGDTEGVWFSFSKQRLPRGVDAAGILDAGSVKRKVEGHATYRVKAKDLLKAFGVRRGPLPDPRIGRKYEPATFEWPDWAYEGGTKPSDANSQGSGKEILWAKRCKSRWIRCRFRERRRPRRRTFCGGGTGGPGMLSPLPVGLR